MPGPQIVPTLPGYIPHDVDINAVNADVGEDGVSAPGHDVAGLREVVAEAKEQGIDLKIVVIANNPPLDTPLRDIATEVGQAHPGSTVLAMSPSYAGTYSRKFDRVTLEAGEDVAEAVWPPNPVLSSENFLRELTTPDFPWTAMTIVIALGAAAAVGVTRLLQVRAKRAAQTSVAGAEATE